MKWMDRLERKFSRYAIPHLLYGIFAGQTAVFLLALNRPDIIQYFILDPAAVTHGEWWRLITFIFFPPFGNSTLDLIFFVFVMLFFFMIASGLQQAWGVFRLNLFVLIGLAGHAAAAFLTGLPMTPMYFQMTLFLAFAHFFPDMIIYAMLILPVKIKWMAWLDGAFLLYSFIFGAWSVRMMVLLACTNYLLFFWRDLGDQLRQKKQVVSRRTEFTRALHEAKVSMPVKRCSRCNTEDLNADIRLCTCSECGMEGKFWCLEHVKEHLKK